MDKFALLLGIPEDRTPSALLEMTSSDQSATAMTSPVGLEEWVTAIHLVNNRYIVSSQYMTTRKCYVIVIFDSVHDDERKQHLLPQLKCLYERVRDASDIRKYIVPEREGSTSASGLFAAAHATMRMHRQDPGYYISDEDLLRCHMYRCLQNEEVTSFPVRHRRKRR